LQGLNGTEYQYPNMFEFGGIKSTPLKKWDEVFMNSDIAALAKSLHTNEATGVLEIDDTVKGYMFSDPVANNPDVIFSSGDDEENSDGDESAEEE